MIALLVTLPALCMLALMLCECLFELDCTLAHASDEVALATYAICEVPFELVRVVARPVIVPCRVIAVQGLTTVRPFGPWAPLPL